MCLTKRQLWPSPATHRARERPAPAIGNAARSHQKRHDARRERNSDVSSTTRYFASISNDKHPGSPQVQPEPNRPLGSGLAANVRLKNQQSRFGRHNPHNCTSGWSASPLQAPDTPMPAAAQWHRERQSRSQVRKGDALL
jgi:hypothetical protein